MLPDPVARDGERVLARFGLLGEGAAPVFTPGARYPLAGLLLALPALEGTGLLECARATYGRVRNGFYGLEVMLVVLVFLALLREPRAEGATRVSPAALGRVLGLDRAPEVKTIRRKLAELAAAGKAADLIMALARHHAAARPAALGFLYVDGHARAYFGTRDVQKMHVARLKFPGPATEETWVTDAAGDPVFMVIAEPSQSLAGQLRGLLPQLRQVVGEGRRVTVCFDRGGWSPALFADITGAGFDLLTYRKGPVSGPARLRRSPRSPAPTTAAGRTNTSWPTPPWRWRSPRGRARASTSRCGRSPAASPPPAGAIRQVHTLTSRTDLPAGRGVLADELTVAGGELLPLRPHPFRPGRARFLRRGPRRPGPAGPQPGEESRRRAGTPG